MNRRVRLNQGGETKNLIVRNLSGAFHLIPIYLLLYLFPSPLSLHVFFSAADNRAAANVKFSFRFLDFYVEKIVACCTGNFF